ncbi:hypothetical protein IQ250_00235 [Pseudanabaenaceae cyanobacterium LEGE 13415]|nr:hypothetical protein [Pseudanabaenaceae cyanobacterium LEGE 13415]
MTHTDIRQRAIELIQHLPPERLSDVVRWLESLDEETALITIIQRRLPPNEQQRLEELRDRSEQDTLSEAEQLEFIAYADRLEQQNVERLEALIKLAQLRNVDLPTLNRQFRSESPTRYAS